MSGSTDVRPPGACRGTTADGRSCRAQAGPSGWCRWHDPDPAVVASRREASARGGVGSWRKRMTSAVEVPGGAGGLLAYGVELLEHLRDGDIESDEVARIRCAFYGVSVLTKLVEQGEIAAEVQALRRRLDDAEEVAS